MKKINNSFYDDYGDRWYTAFDDPVALLRAESELKTPWIKSKIAEFYPSAPLVKILDVGCGAGFLTNALASEANFILTGVDASQESLNAAMRFDESKKVNYELADAYSLPFQDASFDVVTAMDFLEHVDDPAKIILEISRVLKPGGVFFFHTFNRNPISYFVIIKLVEFFVKNTPKHMHVLRLFIKPSELVTYCQAAGLTTSEIRGIKPVFSSLNLKSIFTRTVPESMAFEFTRSLLLSYIGFARKTSLPPEIMSCF